MYIIDKFEMLCQLVTDTNEISDEDMTRIEVLERILLQQSNIPCGNSVLLPKVIQESNGIEKLSISTAMFDDESFDHVISAVKDQEICLENKNETIKTLMYWILTDKNYLTHSSSEELVDSIKSAYKIVNKMRGVEKDRVPKEELPDYYNVSIVEDMLKCYNTLNPNREINMETRNPVIRSSLVDEVLFSGLAKSFVCNDPNVTVKNSLIGGIKSYPAFQKIQAQLNIKPAYHTAQEISEDLNEISRCGMKDSVLGEIVKGQELKLDRKEKSSGRYSM